MNDLDFALDAIDTITRATQGERMPLKRVDGEPLLNAKKEETGLVLLGTDSDDYRRANQRVTRERIKRGRDKRMTEEKALDAARLDDIELLADMTTDWFGILNTKGEPIPFSRDGAIALYKSYPVARDQADRFMADRTNFTKASSEA
jgi:hypothetical protein